MAFLGGASSSSTPSWIYDVFLSFHGEDTRKGFTDHLYAALKRKGIITFRDDEKLKRGELIAEELLKAIEKSRYSVVVISKRYAFSKWCLIELTKILKCREETGMIVLPVFYYVDPSHVRKQEGSFVEAFVKHNQDTEVDEEQRKVWRAALKDIGNLSGWHIDYRHEAAIVEDISRKILDEVNHSSSNIFEELVGIGSRASKLISLLSIGSNDVRFIGICGMGGIGKTTLAKVVYDRVSSHFEVRCFIAQIRKETQTHGIGHLQTQLVCEILQDSGLRVWNTYIGIDMIKSRMHNRKIFVVLDDVNAESQLKALAGSHVWFGQGSRVIVTSRDRQLLKRNVDEIYDIKELSDDESLELFSWKAFKKDHPKESYVKLSKDIVHFAQGLPLAIEVFGAYLFDRTIDEWKSAQEQLKTYLKADILDILQISFDGLEDSQKKLFLDIACLFNKKHMFRGYNKLECLNNYLAIDIKVLMDKCLIKEFNGRFWMHDLLKKMGQQIVYRECPNDPGRRSRLWYYEDIINVLKYNTGTDIVEAIDLDLSFYKGEQLNLEGFSKMRKLKMLVIHNSQSYQGFHALEWYGDHSNFMLSNELRYLEWIGYPLEILPINFQPNRIIKLKMPYNCIKQLSGCKNFDKIKSLNMSHSCNLIEIPNLSEMSNLVELDLQYCRSLSKVHSSLGNLKWLKKLDMDGCDCLNKLPDEISLESLEYLNLAGCLRLEKLPNVIGNMKSLEFLDLMGTAIKELPLWFEGLSSLKYFNLCGSMIYRKLLNGPYPSEFLEYKRSRQSNSYISMKRINGGSGGSNPISCLHFLNVFSGLSSLKRLDMSYRNLSDIDIPHELCYLSLLEYFYLCGNKLTTIPSSVYLLPKLRFLYLRSCTSLKTLPKPLFSQLSCLELLHLGYCNMVDGVIPDDLSCFSSLKNLNLCDNKFRRLPDLIQLSQLRNLCLDDCMELKALPKLPLSLNSLWISSCVSLKIPLVQMDGGLKSNCAVGVVSFDYDGRPHQILQLPSYSRIGLSSDGTWKYKHVYIVAPASVPKIPDWFNRRITSSFGTIESCFQVSCPLEWGKYCGGFCLLILYQLKPNTFQEKRKKQKVDECGKSNYGIFDGIDPALPRFVCHFQFNEIGTKNSFPFYAPEVPSTGPNAFWTYIPFENFSGIWKLEKSNTSTSTSIKASIESLDINVEIECGMRLVIDDDLPVLVKVINDISTHALDLETCKGLRESPCLISGFKWKDESSKGSLDESLEGSLTKLLEGLD